MGPSQGLSHSSDAHWASFSRPPAWFDDLQRCQPRCQRRRAGWHGLAFDSLPTTQAASASTTGSVPRHKLTLRWSEHVSTQGFICAQQEPSQVPSRLLASHPISCAASLHHDEFLQHSDLPLHPSPLPVGWALARKDSGTLCPQKLWGPCYLGLLTASCLLVCQGHKASEQCDVSSPVDDAQAASTSDSQDDCAEASGQAHDSESASDCEPCATLPRATIRVRRHRTCPPARAALPRPRRFSTPRASPATTKRNAATLAFFCTLLVSVVVTQTVSPRVSAKHVRASPVRRSKRARAPNVPQQAACVPAASGHTETTQCCPAAAGTETAAATRISEQTSRSSAQRWGSTSGAVQQSISEHGAAQIVNVSAAPADAEAAMLCASEPALTTTEPGVCAGEREAPCASEPVEPETQLGACVSEAEVPDAQAQSPEVTAAAPCSSELETCASEPAAPCEPAALYAQAPSTEDALASCISEPAPATTQSAVCASEPAATCASEPGPEVQVQATGQAAATCISEPAPAAPQPELHEPMATCISEPAAPDAQEAESQEDEEAKAKEALRRLWATPPPRTPLEEVLGGFMWSKQVDEGYSPEEAQQKVCEGYTTVIRRLQDIPRVDIDMFHKPLPAGWSKEDDFTCNTSSTVAPYTVISANGSEKVVIKRFRGLQDPTSFQAFSDELRTHCVMGHRKDFVPLIAAALDLERGLAILVMPRLDGDMRKRPPYDRQIYRCLADLCHAVKALHDQGIMHGDIKPENTYHKDGRGVLGDYGCTTAAWSPLTRTFPGGTMAYAAPEIAELHATVNCGEYNQCADIWSLAVTIHTVLTGRTPFQYGEKDIFAYDSPTAAYLTKNNLVQPCISASLDTSLQALLYQALNRNMYMRPPADQLAACMDAIASQLEAEHQARLDRACAELMRFTARQARAQGQAAQ